MASIGQGNERSVEVLTEREGPHGWVFEVRVRAGGGVERRHEVALSWVDYEYWSHGTASPSRVTEAVVTAALRSGRADGLPPKFDAATARRWSTGLDAMVREAL